MKLAISLLFGGTTLFTAPAFAVADISSPSAAITLTADGTAKFGDKFKANQLNGYFHDKFTFSVLVASDVNMIVTSISTRASNGLDLSGLGLYSSQGQFIAGGSNDLLNTLTPSGYEDQWTLSVAHLAVGDYYFKVDGHLVSTGGGAFAANGTVLAVPEPATYGMLLGGLALLAGVSRRRRSVVAAKAAL